MSKATNSRTNRPSAITLSIKGTTFTVTPAMQEVFNAADETPTDWAITLAEEGLTTRALARPFVVIWAGKKYGAQVREGQRGIMVPQDSDAARAVDRVLSAVFSAVPKEPKKANKPELARGIQAAMKPVLAKFTKAEISAYLKTL